MPAALPEPVERGEGAPLVALVHGSMDRAAGMAAVARHLRHRRTLAWDRRGYGRSRHLGAAEGLDPHVDDLVELLAGRPAVVLGHSLGGCVALRAAERRPDLVRGVATFESPLPWLPGWPATTAGQAAVDAGDGPAAAEAFLRRMLGDERYEALPERTRADRRAEGAALLADMRAIRPAPGAPPPVELAAVRVPAVVAHGSRGLPHHAAGARALLAALPAAELVVVEGAAHGAHTSHPAELAALVERLLARVGPVSAG